jgi:hypothetical protein
MAGVPRATERLALFSRKVFYTIAGIVYIVHRSFDQTFQVLVCLTKRVLCVSGGVLVGLLTKPSLNPDVLRVQ